MEQIQGTMHINTHSFKPKGYLEYRQSRYQHVSVWREETKEHGDTERKNMWNSKQTEPKAQNQTMKTKAVGQQQYPHHQHTFFNSLYCIVKEIQVLLNTSFFRSFQSDNVALRK